MDKAAIIGQPSGYSHAEISAWIKQLLSITGWSPSKLAAEARLAPSTINRFLADPKSPLLSAATMGKLGTAAYNRAMDRVRRGEIDAPHIFGEQHGERIADIPEHGSARKWGFPENWFRFVWRSEPGNCVIYVVESPRDDLMPGDTLIVDRSQRSGAVCVVDSRNGWAVRKKPRSGSPVIGRVIGMFRRL